jgi:hypothetical protein
MIPDWLHTLSRGPWPLALLLAFGVGCGGALPATLRPGAKLEPARDPAAETMSTTGSLRRSIAPYPDIWVVANVSEGSHLRDITKTKRSERVQYQPAVGKAFDRMEEHERPAEPRAVDCVVEGLPGWTFAGRVIEARARPSSRYAGTVVVDVDNTQQWIVPGMALALAVHTDRDPVVLLGIAELPAPGTPASRPALP